MLESAIWHFTYYYHSNLVDYCSNPVELKNVISLTCANANANVSVDFSEKRKTKTPTNGPKKTKTKSRRNLHLVILQRRLCSDLLCSSGPAWRTRTLSWVPKWIWKLHPKNQILPRWTQLAHPRRRTSWFLWATAWSKSPGRSPTPPQRSSCKVS